VKRTQSRQRRNQGGRGLGWVVLMSTLLPGCETYFVDPHAPDLSTLPREQVVKVRDAPVVYGLLFDLNLPNASECTRLKNQLTTAFRAALLPTGREGMELPARDLSPDCVQRGSREYPSFTYENDSREAVNRFGEERVRPVLLYFNNVELPLPLNLQRDLNQLQELSRAPAQVWALATPDALSGVRVAQSAPWTYSTDPRLTAKLEETARAQLPFLELERPPSDGFLLFTPKELSSVREFKGCTSSRTLSGVNFTYGTHATPVDAGRPLRFQLDIPKQSPVPRTQKLQPVTFSFSLEVCHERCERFYPALPDGELLAWNATPRCFLTGSP
jgi:hypothetical protein